MINLDDLPLLPILVVGLVLILGCAAIGYWLGGYVRDKGRIDDKYRDNIATLGAALLGLLALMIGFTFAMTLTRFDDRRMAILEEADAIATTALRARLLPPPHDAQARTLLREYVQIRVGITKGVPSPAQLDAAIARSNALQEGLWQQAKMVTAKDTGMVPTGLFIEALNRMIDNQEKRLTAVRNRAPAIILVALWGVAAVAMGFTGYSSGLDARRSLWPVYLTGIVVAGVILLVQDLDRPGARFFKLSQQPIIDAAASITAAPD